MADNYKAVSDIAAKHLGQVGGAGYSDSYDPSLLVPIPRQLNREAYGIKESNLPFVGADTWNAYEVSAITKKGLPVSGMLKIVCDAGSKYHIESKSIKLYLNSFNMTQMGNNTIECVREIETRVARDLSERLESNVTVTMFMDERDGDEFVFDGYDDLRALADLDNVNFDVFHSDESILKSSRNLSYARTFKFKSDLLRSNCRVTNQPDWGDIFVKIIGKNEPDYEAVAKYIVSHRKVNHFHEEICEMVFTHLMKAYEPEDLMVACLYTRRGGIDINPIRATSADMIPDEFTNSTHRIKKTLRQ